MIWFVFTTQNKNQKALTFSLLKNAVSCRKSNLHKLEAMPQKHKVKFFK